MPHRMEVRYRPVVVVCMGTRQSGKGRSRTTRSQHKKARPKHLISAYLGFPTVQYTGDFALTSSFGICKFENREGLPAARDACAPFDLLTSGYRDSGADIAPRKVKCEASTSITTQQLSNPAKYRTLGIRPRQCLTEPRILLPKTMRPMDGAECKDCVTRDS